MPNHVRNAFTIFGPARDVATFVMRSQAPRPKTGDTLTDAQGNKNFNYDGVPTPARVPFDFHGVVPLPAAYSDVPYSTLDDVNGYEMECATWGVKWGPYGMQSEQDISIREDAATYRFTTAWEPPRRYYVEAARQFPRCVLAVSYGGEGPCFGRLRYQTGVCVESIEGEYEALPEVDDESDDSWEKYKAAVNMYLTTHDDWVVTLMEALP